MYTELSEQKQPHVHNQTIFQAAASKSKKGPKHQIEPSHITFTLKNKKLESIT
mgnify:CR=1 FL=1